MTRRSEASPDPRAEALLGIDAALESLLNKAPMSPLCRSVMVTNLTYARDQVLAIQQIKKPRRPKPATTA